MLMDHEISIYDFVCALAEAVDLVSPVLNNHHKRVTYISCCLALEMNLPTDDIQDIVLASMLHDIGAFSIGERLKDAMFEFHDSRLNEHCMLGYKLLKDFEPLKKAAVLIRYHHMDYDSIKHYIPIGSHIIHLADRVAVLIDDKNEILEQIPGVLENIMMRRSQFHPRTLDALEKLSILEYFWVEAFSSSVESNLQKKLHFSKEIIDLETLRNFAKVVAQIIDFRNRFTATHSSGVAAVAKELTVISGFSERECILMEIAGFLHDLGKLAVPNEILEKNGQLDMKEIFTVKKHTYYTYSILSKIHGLEHIAEWAAHHHERQDGNGYPFHVKGRDFSKLARVMAVADIITALTEDRPYRAGMNLKRAVDVLFAMADDGGIDKSIVELANENFFRINSVRIKAQNEARTEYETFHNSGILLAFEARDSMLEYAI